MALKIHIEKSAGRTTIKVAGEVDLYTSPDLRKAILKAIPSSEDGLAIELDEVTYIDSSGVATLVEGLRSARQHGTGFALISPSQAVKQVLELARLDSVFEVR